eukprot:NODE_9243_length_377_cov_24.246951_g8342_i0.p1 GENE.NODE_9243_length_377_cov_24.246951_g8342_i0~~NODE_9243_length_377_cov_24.246951_g8342_i0.p1  ORF type:complete len:65 (+),score=0.45 NODE_9243_length_377_cov_24.246951_g8342_i0:90-284(+)
MIQGSMKSVEYGVKGEPLFTEFGPQALYRPVNQFEMPQCGLQCYPPKDGKMAKGGKVLERLTNN